MMYTEEQLQQIEYYASIYMTITDIAVILQIRAEELRRGLSCIPCVPQGKGVIKGAAPCPGNDARESRLSARASERPEQPHGHGGR